MGVFRSGETNTFAWGELNARGVGKAVPFYTKVFGWNAKESEMGEGAPPYTEFQIDGHSIAGATEMNEMVPANVPSYWLVYFGVDDVDGKFKQAIAEGAREMLAPQDFPGGRFAILGDPDGAAVGLLKMALA
jgi:predicted enzyme related to lactoylglutathione lyase